MSPVLATAGFVLAFLLVLYFTPLARQAALRFGIVDQPDGRLKRQTEPVPYLGGLAVFLAYLVALGLVFSFNSRLLGLLLAGTLIRDGIALVGAPPPARRTVRGHRIL
ncbi:MAG: hypothetical protein B7Z61_11510, partial [Acidobacteria bacterium 37-71-11]